MRQGRGSWHLPGWRARSGHRSSDAHQPARALLACVAAGAFVCAGTSRAAMTELIGGAGGERTQRVECNQTNAFLTSFTAHYASVGHEPYVLETIRLSCIVTVGPEQGRKWTLDSSVEADPLIIVHSAYSPR